MEVEGELLNLSPGASVEQGHGAGGERKVSQSRAGEAGTNLGGDLRAVCTDWIAE